MPEPRDLLSRYREMLQGLRRGAGPAGALLAPLQLTADLLDQVLRRQEDVEGQLREALQRFEALYELAHDAPATLRTQAKAFAAAAAAFEQAARVMDLQADLLERTGAALNVPSSLLHPRRAPDTDAPPRS